MIESVDRTDVGSLPGARDAGRAVEIQNRFTLAAQLHTLVAARQKTAAPLARGNRLVLPAFAERYKHDESRQIGAFRAQAVRAPGAQARRTHDWRPGSHEPSPGAVFKRG